MTEQKVTTIEKQGEELPMTENKMGTMPMAKLLAQMSWPAMLSMFIQALYNIVDSMFVATISQSALTAVTLIFPIQMLIISVAVGTGVGVNSLIARRLGARRFEEANLAASHGFRIAFVNWLVFAVFGLFFANVYMNAYSENSFVIENGAAYLSIVTIGSLFIFVQVSIEKVLQASGNMIIPMLCSLTGAITNIILDAVLIFGLFGFPKMGVAGAAVATIIGQGLSMVLGLWLMFGKKDHQVRISLTGFKMSKAILKDIYAVGFPSILMQSIGSVMLFFLNGILAASETAVAILGAYFRLNSFVVMPVFGLNQGLMPILGYNYGARNKKRLMKAYKLGVEWALVILGVGLIIFQLIPDKLLMLFSASEEMLKMGVPALKVISLCFLPAAFGIITSTMFQATGHGMLSLWQSLIRQLVGIVPIAWILVKIGGISLSWWAFPIAEIMGTIYCIIFIKQLYNKQIKNLDAVS